jgi:hypothetical protein
MERRISYSLYLVHWPLIVFANYVDLEELSLSAQLATFLAMLVLASAMYQWVETPFRRKTFREKVGTKRLAWTLAVAVLAVSTSSGAVILYDKFEGPQGLIGNIKERRKDSWKYVKEPESPGQQPFGDSPSKLLLLGDSHSKDFFNALHLNGEMSRTDVRRLKLEPRCFRLLNRVEKFSPKNRDDKECVEQIRIILNSPLFESATVVVVVARWYPSIVNSIATLKVFIPKDKKLYVANRKVEFGDIPELINRTGGLEEAQLALDETRVPSVIATNKALRKFARKKKIRLFNWHEVACSKGCPIASEHQLYYLDGHHWSLEGAKSFGRRLRAKVEREILTRK